MASERQLGVYVAGPLYGSGHVDENIKRALKVAELVRECAAVPFVPHLFMFWHFRHEHEECYWLEMDKHWLLRCDLLLVLPGESPGTRKEEQWAVDAGIPKQTLPEHFGWIHVREAIQAARACGGSPEIAERHGCKP